MVARELLAAVLGVALGLGFIVFPEPVVRVYTAGWTGDRHGKYGETGAPETWQWVVRAVGILLLASGGYFASTLV